MTRLRAALLIALASALAIGAIAYWLLARSLPSAQPITILGAVNAPVRVHYDQRRRPFVYAESFRDAFFAQGYLHARHRLWQMEMFRRAGNGRLAEAIGPAGFDTDVELWRAGVPELAERLARRASVELLTWVDAYVAGVNAWLTERPHLPPEFLLLQHEPGPWRRRDVFGLAALMAHQSANNLGRELLRQQLALELGAEQARIFDVDPSLFRASETADAALRHAQLVFARTNPLFSAPAYGSNAWAVSGKKSADGHALFAFDSHDTLALPNLTYDVHLFVGDTQIRGNSVAGLLGVINGFNEYMAWGFTNIGDSQDTFLETRHPTDPLRFLDGEVWYQAVRTEVDIPIRGEAPRRVELITTRNGRLISHDPPISLAWSALAEHSLGLDGLLALNRATSFAAFNAALDRFPAPSANATYADITGRVAQRTMGVLPQRAAGRGLQPLPGTAAHRWTGTLPMRTLPRTPDNDPEFVVAANVPLSAAPPLISADNAPGYRAERIRQVLTRDRAWTPADMRALQSDAFNGQAAALLPRMLAAVDRTNLNTEEARNAALLRAWLDNPEDSKSSPAALFFAHWYQKLIAGLFEDRLSKATYAQLLGESYLINRAIDFHLLGCAPGKGRCVTEPLFDGWPIDEVLRTSFRATSAELAQALGPADRWRWGDAHLLTLRHELGSAFPGAASLFNRGPFSAAGGNATVGRARYRYGAPFGVRGGATTRTVVSLSQPMQVWMITPGGQSGHPLSASYDDQLALWLSGEHDLLKAPGDGTPDLCFLPSATERCTAAIR